MAVLAYLVLVALLAWACGRWAERQAATEAASLSRSDAAARASLLVSELQKYRLIPVVLGEYPDVRTALATPAPMPAARLNAKLEQLADLIGSSAIYLINAEGQTIAASNARLPTSFVGRNYGFRPYFTVARSRGAAEFFGLGTVSGRPGLYLARRVGAAPRDGVIVVKFAFDAVERGWSPASEPAFVTDANGVILITNRPEWRFRLTRDLPARRLAEIVRTRQFGPAPPARLALTGRGVDLLSLRRRDGREEVYGAGRIDVPVAGWTLTALEPIRPIRDARLATERLVVLIAALALLVPLLGWLRLRARGDRAAAARHELERKVTERTRELEEAQTRFRDAREALAHANRLGSIGQITAAVAHEVNQPVAAIRSFAENGAEMLRRGDQDGVAANLSVIARLTGRIGAITAELRGFARRGSGEVRPASLDAAIAAATVFTAHRLRAQGLSIERTGEAGATVLADPLRLEQVLVNLLYNALEAIEGAAVRRIAMDVGPACGDAVAAWIEVRLSDTGGGIDPSVADRLFTPFATSKPNGLGLGLGIARDIAREFGGELEVVPVSAPWRTSFALRLKRASEAA